MKFFDNPNTIVSSKGRVEGVAKVTGRAKYSAEYALPGLVHGVFVGSTITSGRITDLHTDDAKAIQGVIDVISYFNKPHVPGLADRKKREELDLTLPVFYTDRIYHNDQYIALVLAETLEDAVYAASLVRADYAEETFRVDFIEKAKEIPLEARGNERGSMDAWARAAHVIDEEYTIAMEVHNPMEMHATIAHWTADDRLTLYDKNQGVNEVQERIGEVFGIPGRQIDVISEFVGGGFGAGLRTWPHTVAAAMAARHVNRPVKVVLTRPQMFTQVGYRPESWQRVRIGASREGKLLGILHQGKNAAATLTDFYDDLTGVSRMIYAFDNVKTESATVQLNLPVPVWMRAPGDASGDFAVESAIDQLCHELHLDPVAVRLHNLAPHEMETGKPWSTNFLDECIEIGAEQIGWSARPQTPGALRDGEWQIGYGHAVGLWGSWRGNASVAIELHADGSMILRTAMTDIGTGTGTGIQNVAHTETGIPKEKIRVELGDSRLPPAPTQGGSMGMASISGAVVAACNALKVKLAGFAWNVAPAEVIVEELYMDATGITWPGKFNSKYSYQQLFTANNLSAIEVEERSGPGEERRKYGFASSAAHFCIVRVHQPTGKVKVERYVSVVDAGTVINEKAAANQIIGAVVGGIGMALMETQQVDTASGRLIGADLAGYHFAVNADVPIVEVSFINKPDPNINPSGAKGLGEVGLIGCAAAISNAIFNATGIRHRNLPITPEQIAAR